MNGSLAGQSMKILLGRCSAFDVTQTAISSPPASAAAMPGAHTQPT